MLEAIHKESGKLISAFRLDRDLEWQGKQKDKFISPYHEIGNWDEQLKKGIEECEVTFVIRHKRYEGTEKEQIVREHFRIITEGFIENPNNESEEHKLAKQHIHDNWENLVIYNLGDKKISDFGKVKDIKLESGVGKKRADVLIIFEKWHEVLGRGIAFEVQISPQRGDKTILRSFDRATYGYSVCWLWSNELKDFKNRVKVIPYNEALKEFTESIVYERDLELSGIAEKAKRFINEQRERIMSLVRTNEKILQDQQLINKNNKEVVENLKNYEFKEWTNECDRIRDEFVKEIERTKEEVLSRLHFETHRKINDINEELEGKIALQVKEKIDNLLGTKELKDFLKNLPEPIQEVNVTKNEYSTICNVCGKQDAFIIKNGKSYCKECAYKLSK